MDLTTATPPEIDAEWAPLASVTYDALMALIEAKHVIYTANDLPRFYGEWEFKQASKAAVSAEENLPQLTERYEAAQAAEAPYEAEWNRRGGWTRAYLVISSGSQGHVHSTMACGTCFPTTQFHWMTELSGESEQEIVDQAGERACTVCYASAPVELRLDRPTQLFSADEKRRQAERTARQSAKAAKDAQAVLAENGTVLYKTERGATNAIAAELDNMVHYGPSHPSFAKWQSTVEQAVAGLARRGVAYDVEAKLVQIRDKKRKEHKKFLASPQAAQWRSQGLLNAEVDEPGYDPAKY